MKTKIDACVMVLLLIVLVMFVCWGFPTLRIAEAAPVDTYHSSWHRVKDSASEDATTFAGSIALDANEANFANIPSGRFQILSSNASYGHEGYSAGGAWMFAFYGTDAADETFSFSMVGWAKTNGMAQVLCHGDGVLGTQDVVIEPNGDSITNGFWADTINLDATTKWPSIASYNDAGANEVAILVVDMTGVEYVNFYTYDVNGGSECATLGVYGRRY